MTTPEALQLYDRAHQLESARGRLKLAEQAAEHRCMAGYPGARELAAHLREALAWIRDEHERAAEGLAAEGLPYP